MESAGVNKPQFETGKNKAGVPKEIERCPRCGSIKKVTVFKSRMSFRFGSKRPPKDHVMLYDYCKCGK